MRGSKRVVYELLAPKGFTRDGDQYEFCRSELVTQPWGGKSTRVLTKARKIISLGAHPPGGLIRNG